MSSSTLSAERVVSDFLLEENLQFVSRIIEDAASSNPRQARLWSLSFGESLEKQIDVVFAVAPGALNILTKLKRIEGRPDTFDSLAGEVMKQFRFVRLFQDTFDPSSVWLRTEIPYSSEETPPLTKHSIRVSFSAVLHAVQTLTADPNGSWLSAAESDNIPLVHGT